MISSLLNIAAGRLLGPAEYGKVNLFVSAGTAISPFIVAGLNTFLTLAAATCGVVLVFDREFGTLFGVPPGMLRLSLAYAAAAGAFLLASAMQQASGNFSRRGQSEISFSALLVAVFLSGLYFFGRTYEALACAYIAAFGCVGIFLLVRNVPADDFSLLIKEKLRAMLQYSTYSFGGGLGAFLVLNVQGLIIDAFLAPEDVG